MPNKIKYIFSLAFLFVSFALYSNDYKLQYINSMEGLPQADVKCIEQDDDGFLWISTYDGLSRYDGYEFSRFSTTDQEAPANRARTIKCDKNGDLWIGTLDEGLFFYDKSQQRFVNVSKWLAGEDGNLNFVYDIEIDERNEEVWIAAQFGTIYKITQSGENGELGFKAERILSPQLDEIKTNVFDMLFDQDGRLIIIKNHQAFRFNQASKLFEPFFPKVLDVISSLRIYKERIYFLKYRKLYSINIEGGDLHKEAEQTLDNFLISQKKGGGQLWLFAENGIFCKDLNKTDNLGLQLISSVEHKFLCSMEDAQGQIWAGTQREGMLLIKQNRTPFNHLLEGEKVEALFEDEQKRLWVGTINGNLFCLTPNELGNYEIEKVNLDIQKRAIFSIAQNKEQKNEDLIICRTANAIVLDHKKQLVSAFCKDTNLIYKGDALRWLCADSGYLWGASYNYGILLFDAKTQKLVRQFSADDFQEQTLPSSIVRNIFRDSKNNIWAASAEGLIRIAGEGRFTDSAKLKVYQHKKEDENSISYNYVIPIDEDGQGRIWVGTFGGGLNALTFDENGEIVDNKVFTTKDALSNNTIKAIVVDDNDVVWASTNKGLNRVDTKNKTIKVYSPDDGLQSYEFSELAAIKLQDGRLAFGGVNGVNIFDPRDIKQESFAPKIAITGFSVLNRPVRANEAIDGEIILEQSIAFEKELRLKYKFNSFGFDFAAINLSNPSGNKYSYKLEGFDREWLNASSSNRVARYTNIPPGRYKFMVKAANKDGLWSELAEIKIHVLYPPFASPFAFIVYVLILIIVAYFVVQRVRYNYKQKAQLLLMEQEKQQLKDLAEMKINFFTNISHEFRTPLTLIITPLQILRSRVDLERDKIEKYLDSIAYNSNILYNLVSEFLNFAKSGGDKVDVKLSRENIVNLISRSFSQFEDWASKKKIALSFLSSSTSIISMVDTFRMEEIIYNLCSNAIKYSPEGGKVEIEIEEDGDWAFVRVSNSSEEISSEKQSQLFERYFSAEGSKDGIGIGLSLTRNLVSLHNGELKYEGSKDGITAFRFSIPILRETSSAQSSETEKMTKEQPVLKAESDTQNKFLNNEELANGIESANSEEIDSSHNSFQVKEKRRVLIVDDNPSIIDLLDDVLSAFYVVDKAKSAEEALEKLEQNALPALIVSDVMMDGMSGVEFCRRLKEEDKSSHIPVILLTADTSKQTQLAGLNKGADAYVLKPFDPDILLSQIAALLLNRENIIAKFNLSGEGQLDSLYKSSKEQAFVSEVIALIEANIADENLGVDFLSAHFKVSRVTFNKRLKAASDKTANAFIRSIRMKYAAAMLESGSYTISETTYAIGLNDLQYFRDSFKKEFGLLPSEYLSQRR